MTNTPEKDASASPPWFLIGIYGVGLLQAIVFFLFADTLFADGATSAAASAILSYHAWACLMFGLMLIFNTEGLLHLSTGFTSQIGNNNDRVGLQLTQICGVWVLAYALVSYLVIFFAPNAFVPVLILQGFAMFAQSSEVLIKVKSDKAFGLGPVINTHHVIIQAIGLMFLLSA